MPPQAAVCAACHGPSGRSTDPQVPALAAQTSRYIYLQLRDFQEGRRDDPRMTPMVAGLSRDDMRALANYFAAQKPVNSSFKPDAAKALLAYLHGEAALKTLAARGLEKP